MSNENEEDKSTRQTEPPNEPPQAPETTVEPPSAPEPPKPSSEPVTRPEFTALSESVTKLTESVATLVDNLSISNPLNSNPVKLPWTHYGSKPRNE